MMISLEDYYKEIYVGEYSPEQGCYNICSVSEMLENNNNHMEKKEYSGYIPLCFGNSMKEVSEKIDILKEKYGRPGTWLKKMKEDK